MSGSLAERLAGYGGPRGPLSSTLAANPMMPRQYPVRQEPYVPEGTRIVQQPSGGFPFDPIDPTTFGQPGGPATMGQNAQDWELLRLLMNMRAGAR